MSEMESSPRSSHVAATPQSVPPAVPQLSSASSSSYVSNPITPQSAAPFCPLPFSATAITPLSVANVPLGLPIIYLEPAPVQELTERPLASALPECPQESYSLSWSHTGLQGDRPLSPVELLCETRHWRGQH